MRSKGLAKRKFESFGFSSNPQGHSDKENRNLVFVRNLVQTGYDIQIQIYGWMNVSILKRMIAKQTGLKENDFRLQYKNQDLIQNNEFLESYDIRQNSILVIVPKQRAYSITQYDILEQNSKCFEIFSKVKWEVEGAFNQGIIPKLTDFGTQGTYILEGLNRKPVAIFKPIDEEAFAPNNPRGYVGQFKSQGLRKGILSGEGVDREVAAYLMDKLYGGYHGVPITTFVELCHHSFKQYDEEKMKHIGNDRIPVKQGSFQLYVKHDDDSGNYGSSLFPLREQHKIALLDIRILNCDRNEENILVRKKKIEQSQTGKKQTYDFQLIPIDHGYSFPDNFQICQDEIVWFHWDCQKQPFTPEELKFIEKLNPEKEAQMLRSKLKFREICLRNARIACMLLKLGAKAGLTLFNIAQILYREDVDTPSMLENAVRQAEQNYELGNTIPTHISEAKRMFQNNLLQKCQEIKSDKKLNTKFQINIQPIQNLNTIFEDDHKRDRVKSVPRVIQETHQTTRKVSSIWGDDFYPHIHYYLEYLIEKKVNKADSPTNQFRGRYKSENLE